MILLHGFVNLVSLKKQRGFTFSLRPLITPEKFLVFKIPFDVIFSCPLKLFKKIFLLCVLKHQYEIQ